MSERFTPVGSAFDDAEVDLLIEPLDLRLYRPQGLLFAHVGGLLVLLIIISLYYHNSIGEHAFTCQ